MASKKRRAGNGKRSRQGISGNPQRRAGQLARRRPAIAEPDLRPLMLDFRGVLRGHSPLKGLALWMIPAGVTGRPGARAQGRPDRDADQRQRRHPASWTRFPAAYPLRRDPAAGFAAGV